MKAFRPVIVAPAEKFQHRAYGITDARSDELCGLLDKLARELSCSVTPMHHVVDRIADLTDTPGEFAFCVVVHVRYMERHPNVTFL